MFQCHSPKSSHGLQLPCLDFQFLGDLTASNINTSPFPRYLLSPLILALHPHFTYRLNCIQSQNSKVNKLPGLRIPFFVTWASLVAQLVKNLPAMWDLGLIRGLGRSPEEGKGYTLQYSGLENPMDYMVRDFERVGQDWAAFTSLPCHWAPPFPCTEAPRKWTSSNIISYIPSPLLWLSPLPSASASSAGKPSLGVTCDLLPLTPTLKEILSSVLAWVGSCWPHPSSAIFFLL